MFARPRTFFRDIFVSPLNLSQNPPYQGAHLGMNLQVTPRRLKDSLRSSDSNKVFSSSAAKRYMGMLSDITICGSDFRPTNLRNANRNISVDRFVTTSKCTAQVVAQVNRHMYTFSSSLFCRTYNAPVKSTPVTVKGVTSRVLTSGSGAGSGAGNGLPQCLLQTTQWRSKVLMYYQAVGIQYV